MSSSFADHPTMIFGANLWNNSFGLTGIVQAAVAVRFVRIQQCGVMRKKQMSLVLVEDAGKLHANKSSRWHLLLLVPFANGVWRLALCDATLSCVLKCFVPAYRLTISTVWNKKLNSPDPIIFFSKFETKYVALNWHIVTYRYIIYQYINATESFMGC